MTKLGKIVVALALLVVLGVGGFVLYKTTKPVTTPVPVVEEKPAQGIVISPLVTNNATTTYTEMHLLYPHSSNTEYPELFNLVNSMRNDFINRYGNMTDAEARTNYMRADDPYQLYITTAVATSSKTVSYLINIYEYAGGAHGGTTPYTFTYDKFGKLVTIDQVFKPGYLKAISEMSRKYLYAKLGSDSPKSMIDDGTVATTTNFSAWYLTDNTVTFIFGQYQVGPYVLGIQEYPIDKSAIQDILQPDYK